MKSYATYGARSSPRYTQNPDARVDPRPGSIIGSVEPSVWTTRDRRIRLCISLYTGSSAATHPINHPHIVERLMSMPFRLKISSWRYTGR